MRKYAIIGAGKTGSALARAFARKCIEAGLANSRGPGTLLALGQELGPSVSARSVQDALQAETIFLAVPFPAHQAVAKQLPRLAEQREIEKSQRHPLGRNKPPPHQSNKPA